MEFVFAFMDSSLLGMNAPIPMCSKRFPRGDYVPQSNNAMAVPDVFVENANAPGKIKFIKFWHFHLILEDIELIQAPRKDASNPFE